MRYKDIFTEEEAKKLEELKLELLDAPNKKARKSILADIDEIFEAAKNRYYDSN